MTTMTAEQLSKATGTVRRALVDGDEVQLTFHNKPFARIVAHDRIEDERSELGQLRAEVETLRRQLQELMQGVKDVA
ncbi:hypothetical protein DMC63_37935 [Streptomyces sp. WAC 05977]|nr:hypothetical protein DMC63_37935 [Streptomyces sp. WAC 05977]